MKLILVEECITITTEVKTGDNIFEVVDGVIQRAWEPGAHHEGDVEGEKSENWLAVQA